MRLVCPRCAAQYEIDGELIPSAGREVECGSCGHSWHQPAPAPERIVLEHPTSPPAGQAAPQDAVPSTSASALAILREEAALELAARAPTRAPTKAPEHAGAGLSPEEEEDVAPPSDGPPIDAASVAGAQIWLLESGAGEDSAEEGRPRMLPDPAPLAASLDWPAPAEAAPASIGAISAGRPAGHAATTAVTAPVPAAHASDERTGRGGYRAGLAFPLILALLIVAAYAAAPPPGTASDQGWASTLAQFRDKADQARLQLHGQIAPLADRAVIEVRRLLDR